MYGASAIILRCQILVFFTDFQAGCVEHITNASSFSGNDFEPIVIPHDKLASELQGLVSRYRQEGVVAYTSDLQAN